MKMRSIDRWTTAGGAVVELEERPAKGYHDGLYIAGCTGCGASTTETTEVFAPAKAQALVADWAKRHAAGCQAA